MTHEKKIKIDEVVIIYCINQHIENMAFLSKNLLADIKFNNNNAVKYKSIDKWLKIQKLGFNAQIEEKCKEIASTVSRYQSKIRKFTKEPQSENCRT